MQTQNGKIPKGWYKMDDKWPTDEIFCASHKLIPFENQFIYSNIYGNIYDHINYSLVIGAIAISDHQSDHAILQFSDENDITDFFINEIVIPAENGRLTESWLIHKAFEKKESDPFFFSLPLVVPAKSAKLLCENLHFIWSKENYLLDTSRENEIIELSSSEG